MIVCISGGFDPIHVGHIRMINHATEYGDVVVILNNDNWLVQKKGFVFMPENERKEILENIKNVHSVFLSYHNKNTQDMSVALELATIKPDYFANGGDRTNSNTPEQYICSKLGIELLWNIGGEKVQSSSDLVKRTK